MNGRINRIRENEKRGIKNEYIEKYCSWKNESEIRGG